MDQSSFFSSAHAIRLPLASMYMPLARPEGCMKVESTPFTLHSMMRLLFWSVKKTLPLASQVGPSVNEKSLESFSSFAPGATTLCAEAPTNEAANAPTTIAIACRDIFILQGYRVCAAGSMRQLPTG